MIESPLLLRVSDAAKLLGISRSTTYTLIARGVLPHVYLGPGRVLRVPRAALADWVEQATRGGEQTSEAERLAVHSLHRRGDSHEWKGKRRHG